MRKVIFLFLVLGKLCPVFADPFTVTSNADSGPGTLREAITQTNANGSAVADIISFNIADVSEAGRTITLQTALPTISSNITIDASTQPGAMLGIGSARVTLFLDHYTFLPFTFLYIQNASYVKIYGLCFKYFGNPNAGGGEHYAIGLRNSSNITIGGPGKGNMFCDVRGTIVNRFWNYSSDAINDITIQSNVFGLNSLNNRVGGGYIHFDGAANVTIGGPTLAEGNLFVGSNITIHESLNASFSFFVKMQNNRFNCNWTGSTYYYNDNTAIQLWGATGSPALTRTFIQDNVLISSHSLDGIVLFNIPHKVIITGNKLMTDITGTVCYGGSKLQFIGCANVVVGGYSPAEENIFGGYIWTQTQGVHFIKNTISTLATTGGVPGASYVRITSYDNGLITGISNPNSKIQLYTVTCPGPCLQYKYFETVFADAAGKWSFPYTPAMPNLAATATPPDSSTSEFSTPIVDFYTTRVIKDATCGKSNGSITGIQVKAGTHIAWLDSYTLRVVSTDTNLVNVPAGSYVLTVSNGANGCKWNANFTIQDLSPPPTLSVSISHATCGKTNGILSTYSSGTYGYKWLNGNYDSVGTNYYANQLPAGTYYLKAWILTDTSCNKIYGPYTINNLSGPTLNMLAQITPATCTQANGSVTGITATNVTGTPFIQWTNSLNQTVGNNYDLLNMMPGKYRLKFKDQGSCDTITSPWYIVPDNGAITIDQSRQLTGASKCNGPTGSIQQIQVTNGDTYQWINTGNNQVVGNTPDVYNLPPGNYQLNVTNAIGCSKATPVIVVPMAAFMNIAPVTTSARNAFCAQDNGFIQVKTFNGDPNLYTFRWVNQSTGATAGNGTALNNLPEGNYQLFATDANGCEKNIFQAVIGRTPMPDFDYSKAVIKDDQCQLHQGSITGIQVRNLVTPTTYTWFDQNAAAVGNNPDLQQLGTGIYVLKIMDGGICQVESKPFTLINTNVVLPLPSYDNPTIPKNNSATLVIKNPSAGAYKLYADAAASVLLQENTTGIFVVAHLTADTAFYVQHIAGSCSSQPVRVKVTVVDKSYFSIPNAFTPNGDGRNDRLTVRVTGRIDLMFFRVYNRWGQLVYETSRVNDGWNGSFKGQLQPAGTYVWIAEGRDLLGTVIRDKGSFILIK